MDGQWLDGLTFLRPNRGQPYPSPLQDLGPPQALVEKGRLLALAAGFRRLHLWVHMVQVPLEGVTPQPLPHGQPLTDVAIAMGPQLWAQGKVLFLIGQRGQTKE